MSERFNETILSEEQRERQEKFAEFLDAMKSLLDLLDNSEKADYLSDLIADFRHELKKEGLVMEDYLLGNVLLRPNSASFDSDRELDTKDGKIGKFLEELKENIK